MKTIVIFLLLVLISCKPTIYLTETRIEKDELGNNKTCNELIDFVSKNMFYVETDNSYILSYSFTNILTRRYIGCLSKLKFDQVETLFGQPSCKTNNQLCYYLYVDLPNGVSNEAVNIVERPSITFTKNGDRIKLGAACECEK
jgi:hypothetical protein